MKIAVITGASSGLGKEYVSEVLRQRNWLDEIWIIARRQERLEQIKSLYGEKIRAVALDITKESAQESYADLLNESQAQVMLLINNAGYGKLGNFDEIPVNDNAGMVRLNCEAVTVMSALTIPFMTYGSEIINVCSIASFAPNPRMAVYCSTKAYIMSLSRCMRYELKHRGINVIAVCPGPMDTEFLPNANITPGKSHTFDTLPRVKTSDVAKKSLIASEKKNSVYTNHIFYKFYRLIAKILPHSLVMKFSKT